MYQYPNSNMVTFPLEIGDISDTNYMHNIHSSAMIKKNIPFKKSSVEILLWYVAFSTTRAENISVFSSIYHKTALYKKIHVS